MLEIPLVSLLVLFVFPALVLIPMFYRCWKIHDEDDD